MKTYQNTVGKYNYKYMFNLSDRDIKLLYFKMKKKHGYSFENNEEFDFEKIIENNLKNDLDWKNADIIIYPETTNVFFKQLLVKSNKALICLEKINKEELLESIDKSNLSKSSCRNLFDMIDKMSNFKVADFSSSQRKRLRKVFNDIDIKVENKNIVFFDDSIFSGTTFSAAQEKLSHLNVKNIVLFSFNI